MRSHTAVEQNSVSTKPYLITMLGSCTYYYDSAELRTINWIVSPKSKQTKAIGYTELLGFLSENVKESNFLVPHNPFDDAQNAYRKSLMGYSPLFSGHVKFRHRIRSNATVIDGVETLGEGVNHRVAMGVNEAMRALYNGYDEINLIGHSRGAIECILIAHELQRIKGALPEHIDSFDEFLKNYLNSPINNKEAGKGHLNINIWLEALIESCNTQTFNPEIFHNYINKLKKVRVNIFALDPVPGGEYLNAGWWNDHERYLKVPEIVKIYKQVWLEFDCSIGFRTILPNFNPNCTEFEMIHLPGHHGTASGNPLNHDNQVSCIGGSPDFTRDCQKIAMAMMIDFFEKNDLRLVKCDNSNVFLQEDFNRYILSNNDTRMEIQLSYYEHMFANLEHYKAFKNTSFTWVTEGILENAVTSLTGKDRDALRYFYYSKQGKVLCQKLSDKLNDYINDNRLIINFDHALLHIGLPKYIRDDVNLSDIILHVLNTFVFVDKVDKISTAKNHQIFKIQDCSRQFQKIINTYKSQVENDQIQKELMINVHSTLMNALSKCPPNILNELQCHIILELFDLFIVLGLKIGFQEYEKDMALVKNAIRARYEALKQPKNSKVKLASKALSTQEFLAWHNISLAKYEKNHEQLQSKFDDITEENRNLELQNQILTKSVQENNLKLSGFTIFSSVVLNSSANMKLFSNLSLGAFLSAGAIAPFIFLSMGPTLPMIIVCTSLMALGVSLQMVNGYQSGHLNQLALELAP